MTAYTVLAIAVPRGDSFYVKHRGAYVECVMIGRAKAGKLTAWCRKKLVLIPIEAKVLVERMDWTP